MRLASTGVDELVGNVLWRFDKRLQAIEEFALDPQGFGTGGPGIVDAKIRLNQASMRGDRGAEDEAVVDLIRAETREQWAGTPGLENLTKLYRRAALRKTGCGSRDGRRPPDLREVLPVARRLLAEVQGKGRLAPARESIDVTRTLVLHWLSHPERCQSCDLEDYIESSEDSRAYFDALLYLVAAIRFRGEQLPVPLFFWWLDYAVGRRQRPQLKPFQAHRPVNSANLVRDVEIQFTIEILRRVGVAPQGEDFSGCEIVAEALKLHKETVIRIWKERIWKRPLEPVLRRYLEAVSERTGLVYDAEVSAHPACA